ncbi:MAG TPA: hypothetical protein VLG08_04720 [Casimicrobiaceae bacterium]|nr:hypothetical protein [Casimicrobiaceae bacterium]
MALELDACRAKRVLRLAIRGAKCLELIRLVDRRMAHLVGHQEQEVGPVTLGGLRLHAGVGDGGKAQRADRVGRRGQEIAARGLGRLFVVTPARWHRLFVVAVHAPSCSFLRGRNITRNRIGVSNHSSAAGSR